MDEYRIFLRFLKETNSLIPYFNALKEQRFSRNIYREQFGSIKNYVRNQLICNSESIIDESFTWAETNEGWEYWHRLNNLFREVCLELKL